MMHTEDCNIHYGNLCNCTPTPASADAMKAAESIGPFTIKVRHQENYSGEHREWFEPMEIPQGNPDVAKAALPAIQQYGDQCRAEADADRRGLEELQRMTNQANIDEGFRRGVEAAAADPTEAQWGGLARDIMMWLDFDDKTPRALFSHLKHCGRHIPDWLRNEPEMRALDHVPSKGTRCVLIYKAMILALLETQEKG